MTTDAPLTPRAQALFWAKVDTSGGVDACWPWTGLCRPLGYGRFGRSWSAHRLAWVLTKGPIPAGLHVLHRCDARPCCNPAHLWLGTNDENMADMAAKGRAGRVVGEANGAAKLTEVQAAEIRRRYAPGRPRGHPASLNALAAEYGVSRSLIWLVGTGKSRARSERVDAHSSALDRLQAQLEAVDASFVRHQGQNEEDFRRAGEAVGRVQQGIDEHEDAHLRSGRWGR